MSRSGPERVVIVLKYLEGKSYGEISEIRGCKAGTVGSKIFRAVEKLRKFSGEI